MLTCKIGCDFEVFLFDPTKKQYISAKRFITANKKNPITKDGYVLCHDRDAFEVAIPALRLTKLNRKVFINSIKTAVGLIRSMIPSYIEVHAVPTAEIPANEAQHYSFTKSSVHNAFRKSMSSSKDVSGALQTAGMHIHFGHNIKGLDFSREWALGFHEVVYKPLIGREPKNDRAKFYGAPGEFKLKKYNATECGCECRSLSAFFCSSEEIIGEVYDRCYELYRRAKLKVNQN